MLTKPLSISSLITRCFLWIWTKPKKIQTNCPCWSSYSKLLLNWFVNILYNNTNKTKTKKNNVEPSARPLFPQWSHHVYPQFLPGSHPNHQSLPPPSQNAQQQHQGQHHQTQHNHLHHNANFTSSEINTNYYQTREHTILTNNSTNAYLRNRAGGVSGGGGGGSGGNHGNGSGVLHKNNTVNNNYRFRSAPGIPTFHSFFYSFRDKKNN